MFSLEVKLCIEVTRVRFELHSLKIPKSGPFLVATLVCLLPFCRLAGVPAGFEPRLLRVSGIPEEARKFWGAEPGTDGWVAASADGFLKQQGASWTFHRSPYGTETNLVLPSSKGYIVAGPGLCALFSVTGWHRFDADDSFQSGATAGDEAVLTAQHGIYEVGREGKLTLVRPRAGVGHVRAHVIGGTIVVFDDKAGVSLWGQGGLHPAGPEFDWARDADVVAISEETGGYIAVTSKGVFFITGGGAAPLLPGHWMDWFRSGLVGAARFGDQVVIATFYDGVQGYDPSGNVVWHIAPKSLQGGVLLLAALSGGLADWFSRRAIFAPGSDSIWDRHGG